VGLAEESADAASAGETVPWTGADDLESMLCRRREGQRCGVPPASRDTGEMVLFHPS
jgi:hypothetical protein